MKKTNWTEERLRRLFRRYNQRYWRGKLSRYAVSIGDLKEIHAVGLCKRAVHQVVVDIAAHDSDSEIRATLLHEMAHAADKSKSRYGHGDGFFEQIENLLRQRAPIRLSMPEMPGHTLPLVAVPKKFPLCRKAAVKLEAKRSAEVKRVMRKHKDKPIIQINAEYLIHAFEDAAMELTWEQAKRFIGQEYGLTDIEGRPITAWVRRLLPKARRAYNVARRDFLQDERLRKKYEAQDAEETKNT